MAASGAVQALLDDLRARNAAALELAVLLSAAVRIEQPLIRRLRLGFLPAGDPSAEADLWFSPLVRAKSTLGITLHPDVLPALRDMLAARPDRDEVRAVIASAHAALPALLVLEERLVWLGITGAPEAAIHAELARVIKAMDSSPSRKDDLSAWCVRALPQLPLAVRRCAGAWVLRNAAQALVQAAIPLDCDPPATLVDMSIPSLLPDPSHDVTVAVRCTHDEVTIDAAPSAAGFAIQVPGTDPLFVVVDHDGTRELAAVPRGERRSIKIGSPHVEFRCLRGRHWRMAPGPVAAFDHDLFILHADEDASFVQGYLLPALGLAADRVLLPSTFKLGARVTDEMDRGVATSRFTIAVMTPAFLSGQWSMWGVELSLASDGGERLVPLVLADCELPLRLQSRLGLDFRDPAHWDREAARLRGWLHLPVPAVEQLPCPYPGMRAFSHEDAASFHGREAEVDRVLDRLRNGERELYVIGPSGSGKSSLIAAGVLPCLARGAPGLGPFLVRWMRPGEHPAARLGELLEGDVAAPSSAVLALLARHAPGASVLLVIDALEELLALASHHERMRFLAALRALRGERRCVLVLILRADFYGALVESSLWADLRGRMSRLEVTPLRGAALRAAIERPACDLGVFLEPALVERLLGDVASEPGALPFLQEALIQLWSRRRGRLLTLADYQALGDGGRSGLAVAIARRADTTLGALTEPQRTVARRIFLRLVSFGEGRSDTRRSQLGSALRVVGDEAAGFDAILARLVGDRLLTTSSDGDEGRDIRIDLAHEVMITAWPALAGWIEELRDGEQVRRRLEAAAAVWNKRGRGASGLLGATELAEVEAWCETKHARELGVSYDLAAFIAASRSETEGEFDDGLEM